jgi:predicted aspartyl protease
MRCSTEAQRAILSSNELVKAKVISAAGEWQEVRSEENIIIDNEIETVVTIVRLRNRLRIDAQPFVQKMDGRWL